MTFLFDLDGTLCTTNDDDYPGAKPIPDRIAQVNALYDGGHQIIIDTARGSTTGKDWTWMTTQQLAQWGVRYHLLRCGVKFDADRYVDDRARSAEEFFGASV